MATHLQFPPTWFQIVGDFQLENVSVYMAKNAFLGFHYLCNI